MESLMGRIVYVVGIFFAVQFIFLWYSFVNIDEKRLIVEAEFEALIRKRDCLRLNIADMKKNVYRLEKHLDKLNYMVRDRLPLMKNRENYSTIYFITPTYRHVAQKADLTRLSQTLVYVPNLVWIVIEDAEEKSKCVGDIMEHSKIHSVCLLALTPAEFRKNESDPRWKFPRGVAQRNAGLIWLRKNVGHLKRGIVYFGDDDNTYDWRLFDEMRTIQKIGVWPVGLVGGSLVEAPLVNEVSGKVTSFNAVWEASRSFPIDMAGFAVNLSLINENEHAMFSYNVRRGYQESHFLTELGIKISDLEPKANQCTEVYVWHTNTQSVKLTKDEKTKFRLRSLTQLQMSSVD